MAQWGAAREVTCAVNGIKKFQNCQYDEDGGEDNYTNLDSPVNANGLLCEEVDVSTIKTTFQGEVVTDKLGKKNVYVAPKYPDFTWTDPAGQTHTGTLVVLKRGKKATTKGAYIFNFSGVFTGLVSGQ